MGQLASEPGESSLDDPSSRQNLEALGRVGALDDFDGPRAPVGQGLHQFFSGIAAVGEWMAQPRVKLSNGGGDVVAGSPRTSRRLSQAPGMDIHRLHPPHAPPPRSSTSHVTEFRVRL